MERFVWDSYRTPFRVLLTALLLVIATELAVNGLGTWASIPILLAAIAFHAEYKIIIDARARTYERRTSVKPFGSSKTGSLDEIEHISLWRDPNHRYVGAFVFKAPKFEARPMFFISMGSLDRVLDQVAKVADATGIPVVPTPEFVATHESLGSIEELLHRNR